MINKIYEINETDRLYPKKLLQIKDRPNKIYVVGNIELLNNKSIAIVGSRISSTYGEYYAAKFAKENGYVKTMFNRRRIIDELNSHNYNLKQFNTAVPVLFNHRKS